MSHGHNAPGMMSPLMNPRIKTRHPLLTGVRCALLGS